MKYKEIKNKLRDIKNEYGNFPNNIQLSKCSKVIDGNKFVSTHIIYLDKMAKELSENNSNVNFRNEIKMRYVEEYKERLIRYLKKINEKN
jgi:hypothetical protein